MDEPGEAETAAGLARLEGYLISQAALHEAHTEAQAFAGRLSWLGPGERQEIAGLFAEHHLRMKRQMLAAVVARGEELAAAYEHRYRMLRRRLTAGAVAAIPVLPTLFLGLSALCRYF
ncbi:hypothetical protein [Streptomyces sp. A1136]|uniref:hypothetical protein n=1 Tax=Streptomyces sp. A1136 TaxID=2563102 RepID=UPI00109E9D74|nr:hypothetical protein [Streptomyces sp. A1136]THA47275.1 hypothetical protein E6R62_31570 [Streptomyces sp. A1136]